MNTNIVDISALIFEFKTQMDIIRKASSVVDSIISKLENVRFVPVPPPPSQMNASTAAVSSIPSLKRKTEVRKYYFKRFSRMGYRLLSIG